MNLRAHNTMNSFLDKKDKMRAAQETFCSFKQAHHQTSDINNCGEGIEVLVTRKRRYAITDIERKALQNYYLNYKNCGPVQKVIYVLFLKELRQLSSQ